MGDANGTNAKGAKDKTLKEQRKSGGTKSIGVWQEKIAGVEREIRDLEDQLSELGETTCVIKRDECEDLLDQCVSSVSGSDKMKDEAHRLQMEFRNLDTLLELNANMTNLDIAKVTSHLLDQGGDRKVRQHTMNGSCGQLQFALNYTVEELTESDKISARVTDLEIDIDVAEVGKLHHVVEKLQQNNDIEGFFVFLQSLSTEVEVRHSLFKQVLTKFRQAVEISTQGGVPHMVVTSNDHPGERWEIYWDLAVTSLCRVLPKLHLEVHLPEDSGASEIAETMPGVFQALMRENSIDSAIQDIINTVLGS